MRSSQKGRDSIELFHMRDYIIIDVYSMNGGITMTFNELETRLLEIGDKIINLRGYL